MENVEKRAWRHWVAKRQKAESLGLAPLYSGIALIADVGEGVETEEGDIRVTQRAILFVADGGQSKEAGEKRGELGRESSLTLERQLELTEAAFWARLDPTLIKKPQEKKHDRGPDADIRGFGRFSAREEETGAAWSLWFCKGVQEQQKAKDALLKMAQRAFPGSGRTLLHEAEREVSHCDKDDWQAQAWITHIVPQLQQALRRQAAEEILKETLDDPAGAGEKAREKVQERARRV